MRSHLVNVRRTGAALVVALLGLGSATGTGPAGAVAAIPRVVPGSITVAEGDAGTSTVEIPVTLSAPADVAVTVDWSTIFGPGISPPSPAVPGEDFTAGTGTVTFAPGDTTETVAIEILGDTTIEPDDYVVAAFTNPQNATIGGFYGLGFAIIEDDDTRPTIVPRRATVLEGNAGSTVVEIPVTLSAPFREPVTADWSTIFGPGISPPSPAVPGEDFTAATGTVTFAPGDTTETVAIEILGDTTIEPDDYVVAAFTNPQNATIGGFYGLGFAIIGNDDAPPVRTLTIEPTPPVAGGDTVLVRGTNWTPGASVGFCQAIDDLSLLAQPGAGCFAGGGVPGFVNADEHGAFAVELDIYRWGYVGALGLFVDCTQSDPGCLIGAAEPTDFAGTVTVASLPLAPPPAPPATRGELTTSPATDLVDGDPVVITGTGFRPGAVIDVHQCAVIPVFTAYAGCEWSTRQRTTADATGAFSYTFDVNREIQGVDCADRTCYLVASEAVDFVGTYVASPIAFAPPP
jgi:hypothetical protein